MAITPFSGLMSLKTRSAALPGPPAVAAMSTSAATVLPWMSIVVANWPGADGAAASLRETLRASLDQLGALSPEALIEQRYAKFRQMGNFFL